MRAKLADRNGARQRFTGTFIRFGLKNGYKGPLRTVLLADIRDESSEIVTDHLWFNLTKQFAALNLQEGECVEFLARVRPYKAGYWGWDDYVAAMNPPRTDYHLTYPTKVRKIERGTST